MLQPLCTSDLNFWHPNFPIFYLNPCYTSGIFGSITVCLTLFKEQRCSDSRKKQTMLYCIWIMCIHHWNQHKSHAWPFRPVAKFEKLDPFTLCTTRQHVIYIHLFKKGRSRGPPNKSLETVILSDAVLCVWIILRWV